MDEMGGNETLVCFFLVQSMVRPPGSVAYGCSGSLVFPRTVHERWSFRGQAAAFVGQASTQHRRLFL